MCEKNHTVHSAYLSIFVRGMGGGTWIHRNEKTNSKKCEDEQQPSAWINAAVCQFQADRYDSPEQ